MKKIAFLLLSIVALSACDKAVNKYYCYEPVYTDAGTFRTPAVFESPRSITKDGNIYFFNDHLFVVEPNEGIHFIDNSDPSNPNNVGFLNVMGASGLSIKDNHLYITALVDLVIVDITSLYNPVEVKRLEEVFPTALPLMEKNYPTQTIDKSQGIVTSWNVVKTKDETNPTPIWTGCLGCETFALADASTNSSPGGTGVAGSIAQMTILNNYLYVIDNNQLRPFSISDPINPVEGTSAYLSWNTETIFPDGNYLYMGTQTGMLIYSTQDPAAPQWVGSIEHWRACDPVVIQDNIAYVTVRSGSMCGGDINQLDIIDITNKSNPVLLESYDMTNPHGVGIDGSTLFVCDGKDGLRVFDASNPSDAGNHQIKRFSNIQATDVIPYNGVAMVIGDDGIYQYDYTDPNDLKLLSKIQF
ncbi:hypothetical protein K6119_09065 [Paracrocinitomix mangrovi]|uniref:LVIVD repeat-containing protein n=1 Tax=Paracrocinitomix mangrovi TaxID=2862509 RepID=UPI001C8E9A88|nr:hypothetical protein [Paracrocinitomix mangrovi]UKN03662.1 hypothetical protein K6119_09065 [Paracrocinitomix mangrovi]